jgi:serine/threonine-protein kinase
LGRYELIGELARGGMGTVYLARNAGEGRFQRLFAIKVLHPHLASETGFVDMMRDEAQIAARIHHTNVVPILDLGTEGELHYVVMEYIEGPAFSTLLKRSGQTRPPDLIVAILIDALEGLHAAHTLTDDHGEVIHLVHRDVSPPNILVGSDGIGRITDFGIAKAEARITNTRPGMRKGKLQFMSPEQIKDGDKVDQRTDVWAIGAVLWNSLTGANLFRGDSDGATIHAILNKEIPPPSTEGLKPPSCFDPIILRALARDPAERYATALEMADALRVTAAGNGLTGSKSQVARWVTETFKEEVEMRRKAIREMAQRRESDSDSSQVNMLVPPVSKLQPLAAGAITLTQLSHVPSFGMESTTSTESGSMSSPAQPDDIPIDVGEFRDRKSRRWVAIAVAGVTIAIAIAFAFQSSDEPRTSDSRVGAPSAEAPAAPTRANEPVPAAANAVLDAEQAAPALPAEDDKKSGRGAQHRAPARTGAGKESTGEPKSEAPREAPAPAPAPVPKAAPAPAPQPAPTEDFEKNPYLRR